MSLKTAIRPTMFTYRAVHFHRQFFKLNLFKRLCSSNSDNGKGPSDNESKKSLNKADLFIPNRIKKRIEQKGLSLDDVEIYRGEKTSASSPDFLNTQSFPEDFSSTTTEPSDYQFPSEFDKYRQERRRQEKHAYRPTSIDPEDTSILFFPGQGSQFVGMGKKLLKYPGVEEIYHRASSILGYDLLNVCINGPKETLDKTLFCQPAVVVTSLAAIEKLREENPKALEHVVGSAGFSVGEITALAASEMISFDDAIQLVKFRAEAMQVASDKAAGGMLTVICNHKTKLKTAMVAAKEYCRTKLGIEDPTCSIANFLCLNALTFLEQYGKEFDIVRMKRLPVSGAFHTDMMRQGIEGSREGKRFKKMFWNLQLNKPKFPVHRNYDGKIIQADEHLQQKEVNMLLKQYRTPVKWEQTLHILYTRPKETGFPRTYEVGPGKQLGVLLKNVNNLAYQGYKNVEV
ncbi:FABD-like protein [Mya arenaria]|uniref:FABD-like protein n=1 Tax=Mya arenaria TaxID=6604 RepID=A0ABY7EV18_MYAAR|nr:FABD-like protein [Mya arenaria]